MTAIIIFSLILILLLIVDIYYAVIDDKFLNGLMSGITTMLIVIITFALYTQEFGDKHPEAIDVYKGNTTLEILYRDSIPIDTTVIFKNKLD